MTDTILHDHNDDGVKRAVMKATIAVTAESAAPSLQY